jgi:predicted ATPase
MTIEQLLGEAEATPDQGAEPRAVANNLPAPLTPLIGRERDLAALTDLLQQPSIRLVTLVGMGGMGKTRLALHLAGELAGHYTDGVRLIELAALSDPSLLPQAVVAALGLREASGQPLDQVFARELRAKHLLLVLDNCEHLADACRLLAEQLLRICPGLTILATSREVLQITGERVWPVPALATPGIEVATRELLSYESIQLFVERASAANPAFALHTPNAPAVAQICRRLDGIPLAIELAAARLRHLTVEEIAARLDDRFELLTAGSATAVPRQRTLRTAIDWSYSLLSPAEQALLRRLAVFAGGWTLQAAEAVASEWSIENEELRNDHGIEQFSMLNSPFSILELLSQLVDKSLLIVDQRHDTARYRLLETMRAYAHERLADADELDVARERYLAYFVQLAEEAEPHLFAADQIAWLERLALEHDNLRAAIDFAMERADAPTALRLVTALRSFWYTRGHYDEGRQRTLRALALPTAQAHTRARQRAECGGRPPLGRRGRRPGAPAARRGARDRARDRRPVDHGLGAAAHGDDRLPRERLPGGAAAAGGRLGRLPCRGRGGPARGGLGADLSGRPGAARRRH